MRDRRDIVSRLREADRALGEQRLSPAAEARLRQLIDGPPAAVARRWSAGWRVGLATAGAVVVLLLAWVLFVPGRAPRPAVVRVAGFGVLEGEIRHEAGQAIRCGSSRCAVEAVDLGVRLELDRGAVMQRQAADLRLRRGRVTCHVAHRGGGRPPLRVQVSHGTIEVLGTVFSLEQQAAGGRVVLRQGRIRFVSGDGQTVVMRPGQSLRWPLSPPARRSPEREGGPDTSRRPAVGARLAPAAVESLHQAIAEMRNRGEFERAAATLRHNLSRIEDRATRETWSYELGDILIQDLRDARAACRHWHWHLKVFGPQLYGEEIRAREREHCASPVERNDDEERNDDD